MSRNWRITRTTGSPCYVRDCTHFAAVPVDDEPADDLPGALTRVGDRYGITFYAGNEFAVDLARTLERRSGPADLGRFGATFKEMRKRRVAIVEGEIVVADGRSDPAFFGGHGRLLEDCRRWEAGERELPIQIKRLRELEDAGVDVVEFPTNAAVDLRFARLNLAQPVVICVEGFRIAEKVTGRVAVRWS